MPETVEDLEAKQAAATANLGGDQPVKATAKPVKKTAKKK